MAFVHGKGAVVLMDKYDLSAYHNDVGWTQEVDAAETTAFGATDKAYIVGLGDGKVSASGLLDTTATIGGDVAYAALMKKAVNPVLLTSPVALALGGVALMAQSVATSYEINGKVDGVVETKAEFQVDDGVDHGIVLAAAKSVATATTTNETSQDGAASTANGGVGQVHVTANAHDAGTVIKVQHSTDNSAWVDLVTFTTVATTVTTAERIEVAAGTTIRRYLRATSTTSGTGAVVYTVAFARR